MEPWPFGVDDPRLGGALGRRPRTASLSRCRAPRIEGQRRLGDVVAQAGGARRDASQGGLRWWAAGVVPGGLRRRMLVCAAAAAAGVEGRGEAARQVDVGSGIISSRIQQAREICGSIIDAQRRESKPNVDPQGVAALGRARLLLARPRAASSSSTHLSPVPSPTQRSPPLLELLRSLNHNTSPPAPPPQAAALASTPPRTSALSAANVPLPSQPDSSPKLRVFGHSFASPAWAPLKLP